MLRPYSGCLHGFTGDQVQVRGYLELRTTFTDGTASRIESIRYLVVNASSTYNMLLGRPTLNRLGAVLSTRHMKMKLPDLTGKVITIKSDQKEAKKCYENSLKTRRGVSMVTARPSYTEEVPLPEFSHAEPARTVVEIAGGKIAREIRSDPFGNLGERETGGKVSKLSNTPGQTARSLVEKIVEYKLKPDPQKYESGTESGKFLDSLLIECGMETNPERRMSVLSGLAPVGRGSGLPYQECKEAFIRLKEYLASPPILCKPQPSTSFSWHPMMIDQAISSVLVQKQN